jgi:hypothetical protein
MVASLVGAWKQTGASALLAAASVAALYGFVRLFDLARPKPAEAAEPQRIVFELEAETEAAEPQRIDFEPVTETVLPAIQDVVVPFEVPVQPLTAGNSIEEEDAEPAAPKSKSGRRTKAPRKSISRRASAPGAVKVAELVPPEAAEVTEFVPAEEAEVTGFASQEELDAAEFPPPEETAPPHIAPLFEPEPFARMPRRAFGRRGRI